tara:strand:- start:8 stop:400 length:393 start_codon:yes stop_codon:yes gene_type:complete
MSVLSVATIRSQNNNPVAFQKSDGSKIGQLCVGNIHIDASSGTPENKQDFNVSSLSDLGEGKYRVNFENAFSNTDYIVTAASGKVSTTSNATSAVDVRNMQTNSLDLFIEDVDNGFVDVDYVMIAIFDNV